MNMNYKVSGAIKFLGFFQCQEANGQVLLHELEELCSNAEVPELYVPKFRNNYYQMKIDGVKTYGKVFEDDGKEYKAMPLSYLFGFCSNNYKKKLDEHN